ncbi:MAG: nicotinate (nicotinamide) nucleotide adenylyltransferase [Clostridia bacterium]|nr:nicotinate (nicotinamide) nucleotide adenylyltransferase [Clostridia bacterium]
MKIALFGGSFDPIHNGHLALARGVAKILAIDKVVLMPTATPPHKLKQTDTDGDVRLQMCRMAIEGDNLFEVSDYELKKGGASFTVDTLEALTAEYPGNSWYLLMGADMFLTLSTWKRIERIAKLATIVTVPRDDQNAAQLAAYGDTLRMLGVRFVICDLPLVPISSTGIREAIATGGPFENCLPPAVAVYIRAHGLYQNHAAILPDEQIKEIIRARLKPKRYAHSLAVAEEAKRLAAAYGADPGKAYTAGLLHDIMKNTEDEAQLQILNDFGILLDEVTRCSPKLWHAISGAAFIERVLRIDDPEIVTAVRYHTTARSGMSLLEQVLYLADFTSADRDYRDVDVMRRLVDEDKDAAMTYALAYTIKDLVKHGRPVHPDTLEAYNDYIMKKDVTEYGEGQTE